MRIIAVFFIILGVALAGGAIHFGNQYLMLQRAAMAKQNKQPDTVKVWAAQRRLSYGDRLTGRNWKQHLRQVEWPRKAVPAGAFESITDILGEKQDQSRTVLRTIEPGELILASKMTGFGGSARVATQVREGMRAFTIPINAVSGVAGLVRPGDRVDILVTRTISSQLTTSVILPNVLVIATDQTSNTSSDRARLASTATIEVTPTEAQKLVLAQQVGRLTLTLRGAAPSDEGEEQEEVAPTQVRDLPHTPEDKPEPAKPVQVDTTTTVRIRKGGGSVTEFQFD